MNDWFTFARTSILVWGKELLKSPMKGKTLGHNPDPVETGLSDLGRRGRKRAIREGLAEEVAFAPNCGSS